MNYKKRLKNLRKFGINLSTFTQKKINKRKNKPGEHPFFYSNKTAISKSYLNRLKDKQKLKLIFCLSEKHLKNYIKLSLIMGKGNPIIFLYNILNLRFDYILYKLNYSRTILESRQLINHGHFLINGKIQRKPGYLCQIGTRIKTNFILAINNITDFIEGRVYLNFDNSVVLDREKYSSKVKNNLFLINFNILKLIKSSFEFYL